MKDRKAWKMLKSMPEDEQITFIRWLKAELHDKQVFVQLLGQILVDLEEAPREMNEIWEVLYPGQKYNDARMRKLLRDLTAKLEDFFAIQHFRNDSTVRELYLLRALNRRGLDDLFLKTIKKAEQDLNSKSRFATESYRLRYELLMLRQRHHAATTTQKTINNLTEFLDYLKKLNALLDKWWLHEKLLSSLEQENFENMLGATSHDSFIDTILELPSTQSLFKDDPLISLYVDLFYLHRRKGDVEVSSILRKLRQNEAILSQGQLQNIYILLSNHYIRNINHTGADTTINQLFEVFEWGISRKLVFYDGTIPESFYRNIVLVGLRSGHFDKAFHYLNTLKDNLPSQQKEEIYLLNLATYYFFKREFHEVIHILAERRFHDVIKEILARFFLYQAHFETSPEDVLWLDARLDTLTRYIRKQNSLSAEVKNAYLNRAKFFRRLIKANTTKALLKLKEELTQQNTSNNHTWLLEKTDELLQN